MSGDEEGSRCSEELRAECFKLHVATGMENKKGGQVTSKQQEHSISCWLSVSNELTAS